MTLSTQPVSAATSPGGAAPARDRLTIVRRVGWVLLGLQLVGMLAFSTLEYHRYALSVGFGTYAQAWVAIAHGHLDPVSTLIAKPFWRNDAEFMVWPLSLLYHLYPHPVDLLWVQDLAVVLTELVALGWVLEVVRDAPLPRRAELGPALALGALAVLLVNPFAYQTIAYDFHSEVLAALFVALAGRALWRTQLRMLALWVPLALLCDGLAGLFIIGVGVSGIVSGRHTRRGGLALVGVGAAWVVFISAIGGNEFGYAHSLAEWYGYLLGPHHGTVRDSDVVVGVLTHPWTATHMVLTRWYLIFDFMIVVGLIGLASAWGWPMACVVVIPSALNANVAFLNPHASFQTWPALPFVLVGSVMVMARMASGSRILRRAAVVAGALWATSVIVVAGSLLPDVPRYWLAVGPRPAAALAATDAEIPAGAQVIASWGVVGRFAVRRDVYAYGPLSRSFPVTAPVVYFVVTPGQGIYEVAPARADEAVAYVEHRLGARVVVARDHVYALEWRPPAGTTSVRLP